MTKLTARQQEVLDCIKSYIDQTGFPPTRADIARELGFRSANAAEDHLKALARKGVIEVLTGTSRGIRLLTEIEPAPTGLPIIGRVAAGSPILAEQHIESYVDVTENCFSTGADFMLRVQGDSMIEAGIFDADLVAVKSAKDANNGEIVVARVDDEVTVKRLQKSKRQVRLLPENASYAPIEISAGDCEDFAIEGKVVGVLRQVVH